MLSNSLFFTLSFFFLHLALTYCLFQGFQIYFQALKLNFSSLFFFPFIPYPILMLTLRLKLNPFSLFTSTPLLPFKFFALFKSRQLAFQPFMIILQPLCKPKFVCNSLSISLGSIISSKASQP